MKNTTNLIRHCIYFNVFWDTGWYRRYPINKKQIYNENVQLYDRVWFKKYTACTLKVTDGYVAQWSCIIQPRWKLNATQLYMQ